MEKIKVFDKLRNNILIDGWRSVRFDNSSYLQRYWGLKWGIYMGMAIMVLFIAILYYGRPL
jgi:hypothetical protein